MRPAVVGAVLLVSLASIAAVAGTVGAGGAAGAAGVTGESPAIVDLYPNPAAHGDPGEFVTLHVPDGTDLSAYVLADENVAVSLANATAGGGKVTFSTDPDRTERLTDRTVVGISDRLRLADDGDRVRLLRDGVVVDEVTYDRAPQAQVYDVASGEWVPLGATDKPVVADEGGKLTAFVLPDEPDLAVEFLGGASERVLLAGYTISDGDVVEALVDAHERGVAVEVLAEGAPVGGMGASEAAALDTLARHGVPVSVVGGDKARYRHHHAKYAVVDGRALVTTENWKPAGTGGKSSRGWAAITDQERIVEGLVDTFRADSGWVDAILWEEYDDVTLVDDAEPTGLHPTAFEAESFDVDRTRLLLAPDNAEAELVRAVRSAEESVDVKQVRVGDPGFPLLRALLDAAERGVEVRLLLSSEWYVEDENRELKRWLDEQVEAGDLPLSVRLADPDGEFEKIHAKGLIVDGELTYIGSLNWNNSSLRHNREVGLLVESPEVGAYFGAVFESDFERDGREVPVGYLAAVVVLALVAVLAARRLEFEN